MVYLLCIFKIGRDVKHKTVLLIFNNTRIRSLDKFPIISVNFEGKIMVEIPKLAVFVVQCYTTKYCWRMEQRRFRSCHLISICIGTPCRTWWSFNVLFSDLGKTVVYGCRKPWIWRNRHNNSVQSSLQPHPLWVTIYIADRIWSIHVINLGPETTWLLV